MDRTPVIGSLPLVLNRQIKPDPTPMVNNIIVRPVVDMFGDKTRLSEDAIEAVAEVAGVCPEKDPAWDDVYQDLLKESCAYFASEIIRGPKKPPYNGRFLLGRHHLEWDELIQKHRRLNILAARDHGKCTTGDSLILRSDGRRIPIKDWGGGEVIAYDENSYSFVRADASKAEYQGYYPCLRITTRTGRVEEVTYNHRMAMVDGWRFAAELRVGDRIGVPKKINVEGRRTFNLDGIWLLGLFVGDGGSCGAISLTINNDALVDAASNACAAMGWELTKLKHARYGYGISAQYQRDVGIRPWLKELGLWNKKSGRKFVPDILFECTNEVICQFLAGYFEADGSVNLEGGGAVEYYSTSEQLLRDIQHLLLRLGVVSVLSIKKGVYKGDSHYSWRLTIRGKSIVTFGEYIKLRGSKQQDLAELVNEQNLRLEGGSIDLLPKAVIEWLDRGKDWTSRRGGPKFEKCYDLTRDKAAIIALLQQNDRLLKLAESPVMWDEIIDIEDIGDQPVYGISVDKYENYLANDIISHNSFFFTMAYPIWKAGYNQPGSYGIIFSATQPQANEFLAMIKNELLENPKLAHLIPYTRDRFWSATRIKLRNGSIIRAAGFGVHIRGGHPNYALCDDVLNDDDIYSETIRRKNVDYFLSAISNMVHVEDQLIVVGTPMHQADLYAVLADKEQVVTLAGEIDEADLTGYIYECRSYPAQDPDTGEPLFPERYSKKALKLKRIELKSAARYAREFECKPLSDEASLFPSHLFQGSDVRLPYVLGLPGEYWEKQGCIVYTGVDIAMSAETGADYFVVFSVAVDPNGVRYIANIRRGKGWSFTRQIDEIKEEYYLMGSAIIHIEANQMQRVWTEEIVRTTDLPVRKFFTIGVGGRQPPKPWVKGATSAVVNKHHLDRGVPGLRLSLEHRKWRIPRGDAKSIELTDVWIGEMNAIGWIDGKVQSIGEHDDTVMSAWMTDAAIRLGNPRLDFIETDIQDRQPDILAAPVPESAKNGDYTQAEKMALASVNNGKRVECTRDQYLARVRASLQSHVESCMDYGDSQRAVLALEEVKRLDRKFGFRSYDARNIIASNEGAGYLGTQQNAVDSQA